MTNACCTRKFVDCERPSFIHPHNNRENYCSLYILILYSYYLTENNNGFNNINSKLDAKITNFIDNYNQFNMFQAIISPVLRSTILCLQLVV